MALPAGLMAMGTFKGAPGADGKDGATGTLAVATAESVPAGASAEVAMFGPETARGAHFKIPRGLPGVNAVENDDAVATYIGAADSATAQALDRGRVATMNLRKVVTPSGVDDTAAVNAALAAFAADGGGKIIVPRDNWKMSGALRLTGTGSPIHIEAEPGTVFDMTASTETDGILLGGAVTASSAPLDANADRHAVTIQTTLAVSPGDIVRIQSTELFTPLLPVAVKGELAEVLSVSGSSVTVKSPLWDSYSAATTTVTKMTMPRVSVENLSVIRNSNAHGLVVMYARDVLMGGLYAEGARERLFMLSNVLGGTIDNIGGTDAYYAGSGTSYGLSVASSQSVREIGNQFRGGRHAVSHGGTFPTRDVQIIGGTFDNFHGGGQACFDFHPNVEYARIVGATMLNGIVSNASNLNISDTTVRTGSGTSRTGIELGMSQDSEYVKLRNVDVQMGVTTADAIQVINRSEATPIRSRLVEIDANIRTPGTGAGIRIFPSRSIDTGGVIERMVISGDIRGGIVHQQQGTAELVVKDLKFTDLYTESPLATVTLTATQTETLTFDNAEVVTTGANRAAVSASASTARTTVRNSRLRATAGGDRNFFGTGALDMRASSVEGFNANGGISAGSAAEALIVDVASINNLGTPTLPARNYSRRNSAGLVTTQGTAAPTAGAWLRGDRCENTIPVVGTPSGWVCTVAGTPGTWRPLPNVL